MTLTQIAYLLLETIRNNHIVDDERIDVRLLYDWIHMKRSQYIKNMKGTSSTSYNPNSKISLPLYQKIPITTQVIPAVTDAGDYPYINNTYQSYKIVESVNTIPDIIEGKSGPLILSLESEDAMKIPFSVVPYDQMRFSGNGRFNTNLIFGSIRDNKVWFKYNKFFDTYNKVILRAILENPTKLEGYNVDIDKYPVDPGLVEYIKNGILERDFSFLVQMPTDENNDANGLVKR